MKITFCGAAGTVTGSQHLLEFKGRKLLLDCGMFQGFRELSFQMNKKFLFEPSELDAVLLSHAHIDHSGNLPTLTSKGFKGSIYATPATRDLCSIMLQDSAHIQEKDTEFVNKRRIKKGLELFNPLYTVEDALEVMGHFKAIPYNKTFYPAGFENQISVTFIDAGHILGSAQIILNVNENGRQYKLGFTGDLGRNNLPILRNPDFMGDVDYLITESTYGNREHEPAEKIVEQLKQAIVESMRTGGKIIVPAFSVGRTQEFVYAITELYNKKEIPRIPIYVDSPLAVSATEIFRLHPECYDRETADLLSQGIKVFGENDVNYINHVEDSKRLNTSKESCIIISASGMCEAGRILHHLANNISNPKNTILIIGFMAENTLGRKLIDLKDSRNGVVNIFGEEHKVKAKIKVLTSFSAHADKTELEEYIDKFNREKMRRIFLVHGESEQQEPLKEELIKKGFKEVVIPKRSEAYKV